MLGFGFNLLLLAVGFVCMLFVRVRFEVAYQRRGENDHLKVEMTALWGLIRYKTEVPIIDLDQYFLKPFLKFEADIETIVSHPIDEAGMIVKVPVLLILRKLPIYIKNGINYFNRYQTALRRFCKAIRCHRLTWTTMIGLGDPAYTGMVSGTVWTLKGYVYRAFRNNIGDMLKQPEFSVIPCFNDTCLKLDFNCIFDMRIGHIILAGLQIIKLRYI
ncbi:MAG: DUF2953 domain-containing protein [Thermincola sp.]|nr:DUF2953 domain-containing protein [Thermincola sp.]MDT3703728.1 DUF2953 domain-containing protein [Thermincola sp.]